MLQRKAAKKALQSVSSTSAAAIHRPFTTSTPRAAISSYRTSTQPIQSQQSSKRNVSDSAPRAAQAAVAPQTRPMPSPAFNREDTRMREPQPLSPYKQPEMDHSFVGMTGGQIFHEMMRRHGVQKICRLLCSCLSFRYD